MNDNEKILFSVVVPVYNVEKYIEDTILSVINQTIGFEDNIELILVNDGSSDNSGKICVKYAKQYPKNITYVLQEQLGVSVARNTGFQYTHGLYINFLDGDDMWETDAFAKAMKYFDKYEVNIVACRMKYFDRIEGFLHPLDYKFTSNRIINITNNYKDIQMQGCTSVFYRKACIINRKFDPELIRSQDTAFFVQLLADEKKYGVACDIVHYYRKRSDNSSAVDTRESRIELYTIILTKAWKKMLEMSKQKYGSILPYFQFTVMYELQWRIKREISSIVPEDVRNEYIRQIALMLNDIEDYIIMEQTQLSLAHKIFALTLKYGRDIVKEMKNVENSLVYGDTIVFDFKKRRHLRVTKLELDDNVFNIECLSDFAILGDNYSVIVKDNDGKTFEAIVKTNEDRKKYAFDGTVVYPAKMYCFSLPVNASKFYELYLQKDGEIVVLVSPIFEQGSKLNHKVKGSYYFSNKFIVQHKNGRFVFKKKNIYSIIKSELALDIRMVQQYKFNAIKEIREYYATR